MKHSRRDIVRLGLAAACVAAVGIEAAPVRYHPCDIEIPAAVMLEGKNIAEQIAWWEPASGKYGVYDDPPVMDGDGWKIHESDASNVDFSQVVFRHE